MRVGVLGAGSIGCYVGGRLAASGVEVVLVGRPRLAEAVAAGGLELTRSGAESVRLSPDAIEVATDPSALSDCDVVAVCVKSRDTREAARQARPHLREGALVASLQNGVRNAPTLREELPDVAVSAGMVPFNVLWTDGPRFHQGTTGPICLERSAEVLVDALRGAGVQARTHGDLPGLLWGKLLINLNNAVNALAGIPLREQLGQRAYRELMASLIDEAAAVLAHAGEKPVGLGPMQPWLVPKVLRMPDGVYGVIADLLVKVDPEARSSMWEDLQRGRLTEIDFINGEVLALAEEHGLDAPLNRAVVGHIRAAEAAEEGSPGLSAEQIGG